MVVAGTVEVQVRTIFYFPFLVFVWRKNKQRTPTKPNNKTKLLISVQYISCKSLCDAQAMIPVYKR